MTSPPRSRRASTNQQVNLMLQNLLKERFGVVLHHNLMEFVVDELVLARVDRS
jgi:uncharacterized protein (TIGR03435 family)